MILISLLLDCPKYIEENLYKVIHINPIVNKWLVVNQLINYFVLKKILKENEWVIYEWDDIANLKHCWIKIITFVLVRSCSFIVIYHMMTSKKQGRWWQSNILSFMYVAEKQLYMKMSIKENLNILFYQLINWFDIVYGNDW